MLKWAYPPLSYYTAWYDILCHRYYKEQLQHYVTVKCTFYNYRLTKKSEMHTNKHLKKSNAACFYTPIVLKLLIVVQMWKQHEEGN